MTFSISALNAGSTALMAAGTFDTFSANVRGFIQGLYLDGSVDIGGQLEAPQDLLDTMIGEPSRIDQHVSTHQDASIYFHNIVTATLSEEEVPQAVQSAFEVLWASPPNIVELAVTNYFASVSLANRVSVPTDQEHLIANALLAEHIARSHDIQKPVRHVTVLTEIAAELARQGFNDRADELFGLIFNRIDEAIHSQAQGALKPLLTAVLECLHVPIGSSASNVFEQLAKYYKRIRRNWHDRAYIAMKFGKALWTNGLKSQAHEFFDKVIEYTKRGLSDRWSRVPYLLLRVPEEFDQLGLTAHATQLRSIIEEREGK